MGAGMTFLYLYDETVDRIVVGDETEVNFVHVETTRTVDAFPIPQTNTALEENYSYGNYIFRPQRKYIRRYNLILGLVNISTVLKQ